MQTSQSLHRPWVNPPKTAESFEAYFLRYQQDNQKSDWVIEETRHALVGVFNLKEIVPGFFQTLDRYKQGVSITLKKKIHIHRWF